MRNINTLVAVAEKNGFEFYGSFNEDGLQHDILTCLKGKFNGEVIDLYYNYRTGEVSQIAHSTQFNGQQAIFSF